MKPRSAKAREERAILIVALICLIANVALYLAVLAGALFLVKIILF